MNPWRKYLLLLLFAALCHQVQAEVSRYFEFRCFPRRGTNHNAEVWVSLGPQFTHVDKSGQPDADVEIVVEARIRNDRREGASSAGRVVAELVRREKPAFGVSGTGGDFLFVYKLALQPGEYLVTVEVKDRIKGGVHYADQRMSLGNQESDFGLSGIFLAQQRPGFNMEFPVLNGPLNPFFKGEDLKFSAEVYAPRGAALTARAVLYRKENAAPSARVDFASLQVERFSSIEQKTSAVRATGFTDFFNGVFNLSKLDAGEYLLEIYLFHNDLLVAEESRSLRIEWKDLARVFSDMENSIRMLSYLTTNEVVDSFLHLPSRDAQVTAFLEFWNEQPGDPQQAMREYYSRIFEAEARFTQVSASDSLPGWQSNRGEVYCLFGRPTREEPFTVNGTQFLEWIYEDWGMRFLFTGEGKRIL